MAEHAAFDIVPPRAEDAAGMFMVYNSRISESLPSYPEWSRHFQDLLQGGPGIAKFRELIANADADRTHYFSRVAKIGDTVIGIASASALPGEKFTWVGGLTVMREYQDVGVGRALCESGQPWAHALGRPMRAYVDPNNKRCVDLLVNQHGFQKVGEETRGQWLAESVTPNIEPITLDVMELDVPALGVAQPLLYS